MRISNCRSNSRIIASIAAALFGALLLVGAVRVDVTQDGKPIARTDAGADIRFDPSEASYVEVDAPRA